MDTRHAKEKEEMERKIKQARDAEERQKKQQNLLKAQQAMNEKLSLNQINGELAILLNEVAYSEEINSEDKGEKNEKL